MHQTVSQRGRCKLHASLTFDVDQVQAAAARYT